MADTEEPATEQLIEDKKKGVKLPASFGVAFALIFCTGFGIALIYAAATNWNKTCDSPLRDFLTGFGVTGVLAAIVFLALEMTKTEKDVEIGLTGMGFVAFWSIMVLFFAFGIAGSVFYWDSEDCDTSAAVAHRWTFAGVLAFLIVDFLIVSALIGKFGAPFFAIFGMLLANLFQWLADLFRALADAVADDGDLENKPPKRSASAMFAIYVNHATLMWFFVYILDQAYDERDDPCDKPLHACLWVFGVYGFVMTYFDFLYEMFAGIKTREKMKPYIRYLWGLNVLAWLIWGGYTCNEVFESDTCKDNAKDVYRLSFLLSCLFLVFLLLLLLALCAGLLDFLCSGRLRFVVVVETGNDDEDE